MIIRINATVCGPMDHGENEQRKIASRDEWGRTQGSGKGANDQAK